jgi:lysophospholipid acyltransferase (LPLAT)-like uncharacterized protein
MEKIIQFLIWLLATAVGKTWRVKVISPPSVDIFDPGSPPKIYCFWHSALLVISYLCRNTGKAAIVSQSKDGRMAAGVAARWGHGAIFGSSSRGGAAALRQGVRALRAGRSLGITPDGPKGPREVVKPGAAQIAIVGKTPVVTIKIEAKSALRLKSWDRFMIPLPFAKVTMILSEPIGPLAGGSLDKSIDKSTKKLTDTPADQPADNGEGDNGGAQVILTKLIQESLSR